ncbi:hypothetical protein KUV41_13880 [Halomonas sp. DP8Y7-1]|uniref:hypothetical protein n=1 Tax=Halomonas sp. DP8Y7-1 TaxID=2859078 RepID=UPI001C975E70|nr:hypothetical protein [Halomonas sp. DP8Y7-1]MBY6030448.1 hypothetical protein [Halomonas sp. DP8Y7-1]MED5297093.1 hypothetical protein [Pseudomonadota bacterium]
MDEDDVLRPPSGSALVDRRDDTLAYEAGVIQADAIDHRESPVYFTVQARF